MNVSGRVCWNVSGRVEGNVSDRVWGMSRGESKAGTGPVFSELSKFWSDFSEGTVERKW